DRLDVVARRDPEGVRAACSRARELFAPYWDMRADRPDEAVRSALEAGDAPGLASLLYPPAPADSDLEVQDSEFITAVFTVAGERADVLNDTSSLAVEPRSS